MFNAYLVIGLITINFIDGEILFFLFLFCSPLLRLPSNLIISYFFVLFISEMMDIAIGEMRWQTRTANHHRVIHQIPF